MTEFKSVIRMKGFGEMFLAIGLDIHAMIHVILPESQIKTWPLGYLDSLNLSFSLLLLPLQAITLLTGH